VKKTVGVLALQGDVVEHARALERAGADVAEVRTPDDLARVDALVVPGGESTTVIRLIDRFGLTGPIRERVRAGMPFWGTCMGMIVAARDVAELEQPTLDLLDVTVRRNAFGRQVESAEVPLAIPALGAEPFPAVFIRAPWIERTGPGVETLAERDGHGVMVRQDNVLGTSFHPELTGDDRVHGYFLEMVRPRSGAAAPAR
jgi:5'-phosphate synthase pdxT subunit